MNDSSASLRTMSTPAGFEPGAALPKELAAASLCFVWRDDKILARNGDPPTLPTFSDVIAMGIDGARHYVGRYQGIDCIALRVAADVAESEGWQWRGLRSLFLQIPDPFSRWPAAPPRLSNGIAATATVVAAGRPRSTSRTSEPSNVLRADTSFIRACRRR